MKYLRYLFCLALLLSACAAPAITPTVEPTARPATETQTPTNTPRPSATSTSDTQTTLPTPAGTPASAWEDIPVMPAASNGYGDGESYVFTINGTVDEIESYYAQRMPALGYELFARGEGDGAGSLLLFFMKNGAMTTISIIPFDTYIYVMILRV